MWSDFANWNDGNEPGSGDDITIPEGEFCNVQLNCALQFSKVCVCI